LKKRVVVTGIGLVSALGTGTEKVWENLLAGKSGANTITLFDASGFPARIAAEVKDFNPTDYMEKKEVRQWKLEGLIRFFEDVCRFRIIVVNIIFFCC